jgi:hypothetical protein
MILDDALKWFCFQHLWCVDSNMRRICFRAERLIYWKGGGLYLTYGRGGDEDLFRFVFKICFASVHIESMLANISERKRTCSVLVVLLKQIQPNIKPHRNGMFYARRYIFCSMELMNQIWLTVSSSFVACSWYSIDMVTYFIGTGASKLFYRCVVFWSIFILWVRWSIALQMGHPLKRIYYLPWRFKVAAGRKTALAAVTVSAAT